MKIKLTGDIMFIALYLVLIIGSLWIMCYGYSNVTDEQEQYKLLAQMGMFATTILLTMLIVILKVLFLDEKK